MIMSPVDNLHAALPCKFGQCWQYCSLASVADRKGRTISRVTRRLTRGARKMDRIDCDLGQAVSLGVKTDSVPSFLCPHESAIDM